MSVVRRVSKCYIQKSFCFWWCFRCLYDMFRGIAITIATAQGAVVKRDDAITDFENVVIGLGLLALSYIILDIIKQKCP